MFRVIKSKVEEEMEKEDKVEEELLVKNTPPLSKFAHICKTVLHATVILLPRRFWPFLTKWLDPLDLS